MTGPTPDQIGRIIGRIRFGANVDNFEFQPSIAIVAKDLRDLAMGLSDFTVPLTKSIGQVMIPSISQNFRQGGRPTWTPLAQTTIEKHRLKKGYGPKPILVRSGRLRDTATSFSIWSINKVSAVIKQLPPQVWYGNVHQEGYGALGASGTSWFKPYQRRAVQLLGTEASRLAVQRKAWDIFDQALLARGPRVGKGSVEIPQRRFVVYQDKDITDIQQVFYDWMDELIVRLGKFHPGGARGPHPQT
jgi:phage gpG-like protein